MEPAAAGSGPTVLMPLSLRCNLEGKIIPGSMARIIVRV